MPPIHAALLNAYRDTAYALDGLTLRIGRRDAGLDAHLRGARHAALITAFNPFSRRTPSGRNRRAQRRLREAARRWVGGEAAAAPGTTWEEPMLVLRTDPRAAARLGRRFRQNAIVLLRPGAPPVLRLLR